MINALKKAMEAEVDTSNGGSLEDSRPPSAVSNISVETESLPSQVEEAGPAPQVGDLGGGLQLQRGHEGRFPGGQ